jgi:hypothetical protein
MPVGLLRRWPAAAAGDGLRSAREFPASRVHVSESAGRFVSRIDRCPIDNSGLDCYRGRGHAALRQNSDARRSRRLLALTSSRAPTMLNASFGFGSAAQSCAAPVGVKIFESLVIIAKG